jgi:hypothetical protein
LGIPFVAQQALCNALVLSFQEVVHSVLTEEAEVAEASDSEGRTE